jgi:hypothetical protein
MATSLTRLTGPIRRGGVLGGRLQRTFQVSSTQSIIAVVRNEKQGRCSDARWRLSRQAPPCQSLSTDANDRADNDDDAEWPEFGTNIDELLETLSPEPEEDENIEYTREKVRELRSRIIDYCAY